VSLSRRSLLIFSLALLMITPALVVSAQTDNGSTGSQNQTTVLAKVNGAEITQKELSQSAQVYPIIMTLSRQYRTFGQFLMSSKAGQNFLNEYRKHVLDNMIDQEIQKQKIEELGIKVTDKEVQSEINTIIENNKQFKDEKALEDYLKNNQNMSLADFKSRMKQSLRSQKLRSEVTGDVSVTDDEISSYYEKNKKNFKDDKGNVKPLKDVRSQIKNTLTNQKTSQAFSSWLEEARKEAEVEKFLDRM
jgi:parvulin-like peptidyl-prolyl isomerase